MRGLNSFIKGLLAAVLAVSVLGCGRTNSNAPQLDAAGKHPDNWVERHWVEFLRDSSQCLVCHGADMKGGVSRVSCFTANIGAQTCHANGPAGHPLDWPRPELHGKAAKSAPGSMSGFASCRVCHGADFAGGSAAAGASAPVGCFSCHVNAPHPDAPWRGPVPDRLTHTDTDQQNAAICGLCHTGGARSRLADLTPPANVGCFNNTLCHGVSGHPAGWSQPSQHGVAAKDTPNGGRGMSSCRNCHGADLKGSGSAVSCFLCHATAPHSPAPWRAAVPVGNALPRTHTDAKIQNAATCALCHFNNQRFTTPRPDLIPAGTTTGCFNGTLCHGTRAPHAVDGSYLSPARHGADAKQDLTACKECHGRQVGSNFRFDVVLGARLAKGCETCHAANTAHPSIGAPDSTHWYGVYTHRDAQNQTIACALCHGASLGGGSGRACTNCHTAGSPLVLQNCNSCHGNPPPEPFEGNLTHREHDTLAPNLTGQCGITCHNGAGIGTALHFNGVKNVIFSPAYNAKSGNAAYDPTSTTCTNVSCHGGVTTPPWKTGFINVNTECASCHVAGTSQYNSYFSGQHREGAHVSRGCTSCHDTTKLAVTHFVGLNTPAFTNPAGTIKTAVRYNGATCNPAAGGLTGCHGQESW